MPKFSIIIPVYNVEQYLRECLQSVAAQTFTDWECIIVNDGSTDNSAAICEEFIATFTHSPIRPFAIINQPNQGLSAARNAGIKAAKGEYIFLLDGDDKIVPDALEQLNKHIVGQDMICYGGKKFAHYPSGIEYYNENALLSYKIPFVCAVLRIYRRAFLQAHHLLFAEGIYHEDNLFTPMVCYYASAVTVIPNDLYVYRIRENSITTTFMPKRLTDKVFISNQLASFFLQADGLDRTTVYRAITHLYQSVLLCPSTLVRQYALPTINWHLYYTVSRTKLRHRFHYLKYRLKYLFARS